MEKKENEAGLLSIEKKNNIMCDMKLNLAVQVKAK